MPLNQASAADAVANPGGIHLDCAALPPAEADLPAHSAPLGIVIPGGQRSDRAVARIWHRQP